MSFTAGVSIASLTHGSTIKAKVVSHEDEDYSQTFEIKTGEDVQSAFQLLTKLFSDQCGEVKYVVIAVPAYLKDEDLQLVNKIGIEVFSTIRILRNRHLVHSNSLQVNEHPPQNHIALEVGENDAAGCLGVIEAEDKMMFYGDTQDVFVHDMGAIEPELLFNRTMQPFLDNLSKGPTECGSEVHKVVVVDSSPIKSHPTLGLQVYALAQARIQQAEFVYENGAKLLDYAARTSRQLYNASIQPFNGCIFNAMPLNVSIAKVDGFVKPILRRNQTIPTQGQALFTTSLDNQTEAHLQIMVGLVHRVVDNRPASKLVLQGLPLRPRGEVLIRVSMVVDYYEQMTVMAEEVGADLNPVTNGASATLELMTRSGDANLDERMMERLHVDFEKLDVEEDLRLSQEADRVWTNSPASGALPEKAIVSSAEPATPVCSV